MAKRSPHPFDLLVDRFAELFGAEVQVPLRGAPEAAEKKQDELPAKWAEKSA